jgi:hypothetical protein
MSHLSRRRLVARVAATGLLVTGATPALAQEIVVTPANPQGWTYSTNADPGATIGISADQPRGTPANQNGSLEFDGDGGSRFRADLFVANAGTTGSFGSLSNLQSFGFDWYRDPSSTIGDIQAPAFRIYVRNATPSGVLFSELIWEHTYNAAGPAPEGAWQSINTTLTTGIFHRWVTGPGGGNQEVGCTFNTSAPEQYTTIQTWLSTCVGGDAQVIGISAGAGTLPGSGTFNAYADNVRLQFQGENEARLYNFELAQANVVPEPATVVLLGTGIAALGAFGLRRRRTGA